MSKKTMLMDPFEKCLGKNSEMSLVDIIVQNKGIYKSLINNEKINKRKISPEIIEFLKNQRTSVKRSKNSEIYGLLKNAWDKKKKLEDDEKELAILLDSTLNKQIMWFEKTNLCTQYTVEQKFAAKYNQHEFLLIISGRRNADNVMKLSLTFQKNDKNGVIETYSKQQALVIYNALKKVGVHKKEIITTVKKENQTEKMNEMVIQSNDFVVRTNLFRCYHKDHMVEEIIGIVKVVDRFGTEREKRVPCAYCSVCNCFFMLISEYKKLALCGRILCQLIDKEDYYKSGNLRAFNCSSESLLMINGYNVKANNGLTEAQRHVILRNIIEKQILTPHRIVSYLDMFIAQKEHMPQFKEAVEKWKKDRSYVLNYRNGEKRTVHIESIKR